MLYVLLALTTYYRIDIRARLAPTDGELEKRTLCCDVADEIEVRRKAIRANGVSKL